MNYDILNFLVSDLGIQLMYIIAVGLIALWILLFGIVLIGHTLKNKG